MTEKRDPELDDLLGSLRKQSPSEFEMRRWKSAVRKEHALHQTLWKKWSFEILKYGAAAGLGFVVGQGLLNPDVGSPRSLSEVEVAATASKSRIAQVEEEEMAGTSAGFELVRINLD